MTFKAHVDTVRAKTGNPTIPDRRATLAISALLAFLTLLLLALLHVLSPEYDASWRMVSEYANGRYAWVLAAFFLSWAASTWLLAYALRPLADNWLSKAGVALLVIAGLGEAMAAVFDINHPLHMLAAVLGMNGLPIAAILLGYGLNRSGHWGGRRKTFLALSWLPLLSVVLMSAAMAHFFSALSAAGVTMETGGKPLAALPPGVVVYGGWANRLLVVAYCVWAIAVALQLRASRAGAVP